MKMIDKETYDAMEMQMYNRSRDIDCAIFNSIMLDMPKEYAVDCIMMYQNSDGGIGNQLELNSYNPASSVFQTYEAMKILYYVGYSQVDDDENFLELIKRMCSFIYNKSVIDKNRFVPVPADNNKFAHGKAYEYDESLMDRFNYYPTMAILGFTLYFLPSTSPYYRKAIKMVEGGLNDFYAKKEFSKTDLLSYAIFLDCVKRLKLTTFDVAKLENKLNEEALVLFEKNKNIKPLDIFIFNDITDPRILAMLDDNLDDIISSVAVHGLWEQTEKWDNTYPEQDSCALKWMGVMTYRNMFLLKKYNRIEK